MWGPTRWTMPRRRRGAHHILATERAAFPKPTRFENPPCPPCGCLLREPAAGALRACSGLAPGLLRVCPGLAPGLPRVCSTAWTPPAGVDRRAPKIRLDRPTGSDRQRPATTDGRYRLVGDVDYAEVKQVASKITPVPVRNIPTSPAAVRSLRQSLQLLAGSGAKLGTDSWSRSSRGGAKLRRLLLRSLRRCEARCHGCLSHGLSG